MMNVKILLNLATVLRQAGRDISFHLPPIIRLNVVITFPIDLKRYNLEVLHMLQGRLHIPCFLEPLHTKEERRARGNYVVFVRLKRKEI